MGFEKFENAQECVDECKRIAATLTGRPGEPVHLLSGTPAESLWPGKNINYNGDVYDLVAFGDDRPTPWGPLPGCILAIRTDIVRVICGETTKEGFECADCRGGYCYSGLEDPCPANARACPMIGKYEQCAHYKPFKKLKMGIDPALPGGSHTAEIQIKKPLMGKDWKPAPGFERPW